MADEDSMSSCTFEGFSHPDNIGFTRIPNDWFEVCACIDNLAELKVVLYVIRHTWGFLEYDEPKKITIEEFAHGRKKRDRTTMDSGTGLGITAIKDGVRKAVEHGYLITIKSQGEPGWPKKYYVLRMKDM